jgi:hypothetical protein
MLTEPESTGAESPVNEAIPTTGHVVPDFFQEDDEPALRSQAQWLEDQLELSNPFFARFLRIAEPEFGDWRLEKAPLPLDRQDALRRLWRTVLHLLSFMGMDHQRVQTLLEHQVPLEALVPRRHPLAPSWCGTSLKSYLEEHGPDVLPDVDGWVTGFRLGNPYAH